MSASRLLPLALCLTVSACTCGGGRLIASGGGNLRVTLNGADTQAVHFEVTVAPGEPDSRDDAEPINTLPLVTEIDALPVGSYLVEVKTLDANSATIASQTFKDVAIHSKQTTDLVVNLIAGFVEGGGCDADAGAPLCAACVDGVQQGVDDDPRCGTIDCSGLNGNQVQGDNTAAGAAKSCVHSVYAAVTDHRCVQTGECVPANGPRCNDVTTTVLASAGVCHTISGCESGSPSVDTAPDGTPCGGSDTCQHGQCMGAPGSDVGCSDGTREGFVSQTTYPDIAACSGAWDVPGVTRPNLVPTCGRGSGNSSANTEGTGCAAADLCAAGWHVCNGMNEVAQKAPQGCGDSVPPGTAAKMLFFAVNQPSQQNTQCDTTGDNDVFGCGNLGTQLTAAKGCGVLDHALASVTAGSCGFNEAEPGLGPWQCIGGTDSHLHEGAVVTKKGCPNNSCSYDGNPIGNSDKGGVLCCRD